MWLPGRATSRLELTVARTLGIGDLRASEAPAGVLEADTAGSARQTQTSNWWPSSAAPL
jgi:hypothetical protein